MIIRNKYKNKCAICNDICESGIGWCVNVNNKWTVYCDEHAPKKQTIQQERKITANGCVFMPKEPANLPLVRSFPGAKWDNLHKCWRVSLDPGDRIRVIELAVKLNLQIDPLLLKIEMSEEAKLSSKDGLYPYQVLAVDWLSKGVKRLLADEMGLGKSIEALKAIPINGKAIIVSPAAVKYNWKEECLKWRKDLEPVVINGNDSFILPHKGQVVIVNYDILPDIFEAIPDEDNKWIFTVNANQYIKDALKDCILIADEVQKVKNYKTARSRKMKGLSSLCGKVWALTGTPLLNYPQDLFGVLDNLNMQYDVFHGWNNFVNLMGGVRNRFGGYTWGTPNMCVPELMKKVMLRRLRKDVLPDLPDKTYTTITVDMPNELKGICDQIFEEFGDYFDEAFKQSEASKVNLPPFEKFSEIRAKLALSRIDSLIEIVENNEENNIPLVVFSAHKEPIKVIGKRKGWGCITGETSQSKRQEIVNKFQSGELIGIASTIKAGGVGLTMTRAWKAIFVDLDWVPGENKQAEDRLARIGQKSNKIEIVQLVSDHILDKHVLKLLNWKAQTAYAALDKEMEVVNYEHKETHRMLEKPIMPVKKDIILNKKESKIKWTGKIEIDPEIPF